MTEDATKILLVEPDSQLVELLVESLVRRFNAHITCVADAESCLDVDVADPHDLIIAELHLSGRSALELAQNLLSLGSRPVILLADKVTADEAIDAMRLGISDLLCRPFPVHRLLDGAERQIRGQHLCKQQAIKYRRMREVVRKVIRERRELKQRTELVCRDLVDAHRRLVDRVLSFEEMRWRQPG